MQSFKQQRRWIFLLLALTGMAMVLTGCGGGGGGGDGSGGGSSSNATGTISGTVAGTIIVAVNAKDEVIATVEAQGESGSKSFTLTGIPLNAAISLYLVTDGGTYPMVFSNGTKDAFLLGSSTPLNLGHIPVDTVNKIATPAIEPSTPSSSNKRSTIPHSLNNPSQWGILGRNVEDLIKDGIGAARNGWAAGANAHVQQATIRAVGQSSLNKTRMLYAFSRLAAMAQDTRYDGTNSDFNRVGDFLNRFGCDNDTNPSLTDFDCPTTMPSTAPTGDNVITYMGSTMTTELQAALSSLEAITDTSFSTRWAGIDVNSNGSLDDTEPFGEWVNANADKIIDSSELSSKISWSGSFHKNDIQVKERVDIDYSDILIFKAFIRYNLAQIKINQAYQWNASFSQPDGLTEEQFLTNNATVGTLSTGASTYLSDARTLLSTAVDNLTAAIDSVQAETDGQDADLFTINASEVAATKTTLNEFKLSLTSMTTISESGSDRVMLDLSRFFSGLSLRALIPPVTGNEFSGLFPDPTLGGVLVNGTVNGSINGFSLNSDLYPANGIPDVLDGEWISVRVYQSAGMYGMDVIVSDPAVDSMSTATHLSSVALAGTSVSQWSAPVPFYYSSFMNGGGRWIGSFGPASTFTPTFPLDVTLSLTHKNGTASTINLSVPSLGNDVHYPDDNTKSPDSVTLTVSDAQLTEGDSGTVTAVYTVTLSSAHSQIVRVNYSTGDGTAITGNDYTMTSGMLEFAIGETSKTISVPVLADNLDENSETFHVMLNSPTNATIIRAQATATIIDNDPGEGGTWGRMLWSETGQGRWN